MLLYSPAPTFDRIDTGPALQIFEKRNYVQKKMTGKLARRREKKIVLTDDITSNCKMNFGDRFLFFFLKTNQYERNGPSHIHLYTVENHFGVFQNNCLIDMNR